MVCCIPPGLLVCSAAKGPSMPSERTRTLILGIGNLLLGDEGAGVHVARHLLAGGGLPLEADCLDGGTGSLVLLDPMQSARRIILVDATMDGQPPGTVVRIVPKFSTDFPPSLSAHDIGLRDVLDSFYLLGDAPEVVLYAVSIGSLQGMSLELSPEVAAAVPRVAAQILAEVKEKAGEGNVRGEDVGGVIP